MLIALIPKIGDPGFVPSETQTANAPLGGCDGGRAVA